MTKHNTKRYIMKFLRDMPPGTVFQEDDLIRHAQRKVMEDFGIHVRPHGGTVLRYVRQSRAEYGDIELVDHNKSIYRKTGRGEQVSLSKQ